MTTLNAMRQAAYKQRHLGDGQTARLDLLVDAETKRALQRMAARQGVTLREVLQRLVAGAATGTATSSILRIAETDQRDDACAAMCRESKFLAETTRQKFERARTAALQALARRTPPAHDCVERHEILRARGVLIAKGVRW